MDSPSQAPDKAYRCWFERRNVVLSSDRPGDR
jgi:hypothetical protein